MNRTVRVLVALGLIFISASAMGDWHVELVEPDVGAGSLALDSSDHPHIVYFDGNVDRMKYAYFDGDTWHFEIPDDSSVNGVFEVLAIDSSDHLHVAYQDDTNRSLRYAHHDDSGWQTELVTDSGWYDGNWIAMALDSAERPYITHFDSGMYGMDLLYAYHDGSSWQFDAVETECTGYRYSGIAIDSDDNAHVCYNDDYPTFDLRYAVFDGMSWSYEIVDASGQINYYNSIALDSTGLPHIAYHEVGQEDLRYAYFDGSVWHTEIVDSFDRVGMYLSMALDDDDNPHISYYDNTYDRVKYAYHDGSGWSIEVVDDPVEDVGWLTSIDIDSTGMPHISYAIAYNGGLKYAYAENLTGVEEGASPLASSIGRVQIFPNPFNPRTTIQYKLPEPAVVSLRIYDPNGRLVDVLADEEAMPAGSHSATWSAEGQSSGIYICQFEAGGHVESRRMALIQ